MHHSYYWLWVGNSKLINGLIVADSGASLYAEAQAYTVNMLIGIEGGV